MRWLRTIAKQKTARGPWVLSIVTSNTTLLASEVLAQHRDAA